MAKKHPTVKEIQDNLTDKELRDIINLVNKYHTEEKLDKVQLRRDIEELLYTQKQSFKYKLQLIKNQMHRVIKNI